LKSRLDKVKTLKPRNLIHARKIGMQLFGGEVEESVYELTGLQVVGFISKANFLNNDTSVKGIKIKNDTGALYTSIDKELALQLGFEDVLNSFSALNIPKKFETTKEAHKKKAELKEYIATTEGLYDLSIIKSGNFISLRPKVSIKVEMEGITVDTFANINERSNMIYKAIIGRRALRKNFLVDSNKLFDRYKD